MTSGEGKQLTGTTIRTALLVLVIGACLFFSVFGLKASTPETGSIKLPPGFKIDIYASGVKGARSLAVSPNGTVFVGTKDLRGSVYAVKDKDGDGRADSVTTIARNLYSPNGLAFKNGSLYIAVINGVMRIDDIENRIKNPPAPVDVNVTLPREVWHGNKYISFGPDGWLYIPVGAPCNVCEQADERFATMMRMKPDGSNLEIFARGIRNTVGFDWHPITRELWFTDNGRDYLGDNQPPDELNCAPKKGMNFGFPYRHGLDLLDPEFGKKRGDSAAFTPCTVPLGPHVAALGMRFYTGNMFPPEYKNVIFIAEHGSWNRTTPIGYRITTVRLDPKTKPKYEVFAEGWLKGTMASGRPVDVLQMADGSLLVSDDSAGVIYRISYKKS